MLNRHGFTLMEMIVVLIIIGVVVAIAFPSFTQPSEQARAQTAENNLLAIYAAERNYINNNGTICINSANTGSSTCNTQSTDGGDCAGNLADINCNLSLNIQDDGTYTYSCVQFAGPTVFQCVATRTLPGPSPYLVIQVENSGPLSIQNNVNPVCTSATGNTNWCPY